MGILDDAIREHLELRRQHGADPDELRQVERSVLGGGDAAEVPEAQAAAAEQPEAQPPEAEEHVEPAPAEPEAAEPETPEPEHVDQPTRQFTAAEVAAAERPARPEPAGEPEPGEHDELEETPEFLQETPEHDRLWFEQKPPKDFDF